MLSAVYSVCKFGGGCGDLNALVLFCSRCVITEELGTFGTNSEQNNMCGSEIGCV